MDPVIGHLLKCVGLQQFRCQSHAFADPANIISMLEITIVEGRLDAWVGRAQPDIPEPSGNPSVHEIRAASPWMNLVERFFRDLTEFITEKGFASTRELADAII